jgi:outer membrane protein OmpA-like peptidoglycan-associated protein
MRKFLLAAALVLAASTSVFAQSGDSKQNAGTDKYQVVTNHFWNDWFFNLGGGAGIFIGDHSSEMDFKDRIFGTGNVMLGKWFTPGIGARFGAQFDYVRKYASQGIHQDGSSFDKFKGQAYYKSKFKSWNFAGDVLFNLSNLLCGYNPNRFWSFIPYAGVGYMVTWDAPKKNYPDISVGILNSFRLGKAVDLNLDVRGKAFTDSYDGFVQGHDNDGILTASLGLTIRLGKQGWSRQTPTDPNLKFTDADMDGLRGKVNDLLRDNESLKNRLANQKVQIDTLIKKKTVVAPCMVIFDINKSVLRRDMRVNLKFFAEQVKSQKKNVVYTITGYADKGTGSAKRNAQLSKERAQVVYDCLVNEFGLSPNQLRMDSKGGVDNMFYNDPTLSRATITEAE